MLKSLRTIFWASISSRHVWGLYFGIYRSTIGGKPRLLGYFTTYVGDAQMLIGGAMAIMREISKEPDRVLLGAVLSVSSVLATSVEISNSLASHIIKKAAIVLKWIYSLYTSLFISWLYLPSRSLKRLLLYAQLPALLAFSINKHHLFQYTIHLPSVVLCFAFSSLVSLEIYQRS